MRYILVLLLLLAACTPEPKPQGEIIKVKFSEDSIISGASTELIVNARNAGPKEAQFKFVIMAEGYPDRVQFEHPTDLMFNLRPQETTGERRILVTAFSDTIETEYEFKVQWQDMEGRVLDEKSDVLAVKKQPEQPNTGILDTLNGAP